MFCEMYVQYFSMELVLFSISVVFLLVCTQTERDLESKFHHAELTELAMYLYPQLTAHSISLVLQFWLVLSTYGYV